MVGHEEEKHSVGKSFYNQELDHALSNKSTGQRIVSRLFARKDFARLRDETSDDANTLRRALTAFDLTAIGIGGIIGGGIFVLGGLAAELYAGPSVMISFVVAAIAASFAALSYSEMACMIPVSGSAYTYAYATMGEFLAWIIGWDLIVEYLFGAASVCVSWSKYFVAFLKLCGASVDERFTNPPIKFKETANGDAQFIVTGDYMNLPGFFMAVCVTIILCLGIRESKLANNIFVSVKIFVVLLFIFAASKWVNPNNWDPLFPPRIDDNWRHYGVTGMFAAAQVVFFAYIGFDAVSTAGQESKNPQRDLPIGIMGSLVICTILYVLFTLVLTGLVPYTEFKTDVTAPIVTALGPTGQNWLTIIVTLGACIGLTSVILIMMLGQSRIFYSIAHDGLLPTAFAKVHPRFKTPLIPTIVTGTICSLLGGFLPVDLLANMTSVGTLLAFFLVHIGIILLRFTRPDEPRRFKIPGPGFTWMIFPILGCAISILLIALADRGTIYRVFIWMGLGILIYIFYGYKHSRMFNRKQDELLQELDKQAKPI
ncbi:uncharacterized protein VTP21DRAFT_1245 [Calcarisporiella thermophila]|uniref:uncharacterized protein n=1 Tax=Calcarisporiella thermophila TaxID=911321 RepID=UPI00374307EB